MFALQKLSLLLFLLIIASYKQTNTNPNTAIVQTRLNVKLQTTESSEFRMQHKYIISIAVCSPLFVLT